MTGSAPASVPARHDDTRSDGLDNRLFVVVSAILIVLVLICIIGLTVEIAVYRNAINDTTDSTDKLSFARALDAAILKTSGLFLGYLLSFTGALYVLRIATAHYRLSLTSGTTSGSLQTSSPGLVIITLGVLLVAIAILHTTAISLTSTKTGQPAPKSDGQPPARSGETGGASAHKGRAGASKETNPATFSGGQKQAPYPWDVVTINTRPISDLCSVARTKTELRDQLEKKGWVAGTRNFPKIDWSADMALVVIPVDVNSQPHVVDDQLEVTLGAPTLPGKGGFVVEVPKKIRPLQCRVAPPTVAQLETESKTSASFDEATADQPIETEETRHPVALQPANRYEDPPPKGK